VIVELKVGSGYTLVHGSGHGVDLHVGPGDDGRNDVRSNIQIDQILRGTNPKLKSRANKSGRWTFSVQCQKASIEAAADYKFRYPIELPDQGDIWVTQDNKITKLINACIENCSTAQIGITVIINYSIVYGQVTFATVA